MAITVDWPTKVISVPRADMVLIQSVPTEIRQLDLNEFRLDLKALEADEGMPYLDMHSHNTTVTVGGAILARVISIINDYTVTFEDGQYAVNLVGANSNVGDVVNVNQVSIRSANSAGLQDLNSLQAASFGGMVAIDTGSSYSGTTFPVGTKAYPVNNIEGAYAIMQERGISTMYVIDDLDFDGQDFGTAAFTVTGKHPQVVITATDVTTYGGCIENCVFSGSFEHGSFFVVSNCSVGDVSGASVAYKNCSLSGTLTPCSDGELTTNFEVCVDGVPGSGAPTIDMTDASSVGVWGYNGGLKLANMTDPLANVSINLSAGRLVIEATCTAGTVLVKGVGLCQNLGGGSVTVDTSGLINPALITEDIDENSLVRKVLTNKTITDPDTGVMTVYDDDDTTPLVSADIFEDADGTTPFSGSGANRRDRLT